MMNQEILMMFKEFNQKIVRDSKSRAYLIEIMELKETYREKRVKDYKDTI